MALVEAPPLQDFPAHCAATQAVMAGGTATLEVVPGFHQSQGYYALAALLGRGLGAVAANRWLLALALGALPLSVWSYATAVGARGRLALAVSVGGALGMPVAMGFLPWCAALPAAFGAAALLLRLPQARRHGAAADAGLGVAVALAGLGLFALHGLAPVVLAGLLAASAPTWRRAAVVAVGAVLPTLLLGGGGLAGLVWESPLARVASAPGLLGLLTPDPLDDVLAAALLLALAVGVAPALRRPRGVVGLVAVLGCLLLPDTVDRPRIIRFATRFLLPALVLLALSERHLTPWGRRLERAALAVAALLAAFSATALWLDGEVMGARNASIREAFAPHAGSRVGLLTLSRPERGTLVGGFAGLHAPRLLDAEGLAASLGPFFHDQSPVRLAPGLESVADLATRDTLAYVAALGAQVDVVIGDYGDEAPILEALAVAGYQDCHAFASEEPRWRLWARRCPAPGAR